MPNYRPTWVEINKTSLIKNFLALKGKIHNHSKILAVVKANAYGHGVGIVSETLKKYVDAFGVATIEEGVSLRENKKIGGQMPVIILGTLWPFTNFRICAEYNLIPTISSYEGIVALSALSEKLKKTLPFYLKVDTGMGRIGIQYNHAEVFVKIKEMQEKNAIRCEGVYSHFSCADTDLEFSREQLKKFLTVKKISETVGLKVPVFSIANSAGIINLPESHLDMVRPGLSLYGLKPTSDSEKKINLQPVLSWKTRVVFLKKVPPGTPISYQRQFITKRRSIIATLPVGYADGYRLGLSNRGKILIKGMFAPVVGRVTMDMLMVDVTHIKGVSVGDEVVLIGEQSTKKISVEEIAKQLNTISYEVTCGISYRVPRVAK